MSAISLLIIIVLGLVLLAPFGMSWKNSQSGCHRRQRPAASQPPVWRASPPPSSIIHSTQNPWHWRKRTRLFSDAGGGGDGGDLKAALNLIRKSANVFSALEDDLDEEEIERQVEEEVQEERERQEQRQRERDAKKNKEHRQQQQNDGDQEPLKSMIPGSGSFMVEAKDDSSLSPDKNTTGNEVGFELQRRLDDFDRRAKRTRIVLLKKLALWAFEMCATTAESKKSDGRQEGDAEANKKIRKQYRVDRRAFYSGMLLVHLHLAKYVGVAACNPPTRDQVYELFELADHDRSGYLNEQEFTNAVVVACAPISSRIGTYWALLAVLPMLVESTGGVLARVMRHYVNCMPSSWYQRSLALMEWIVEQMLSILFFSILVPYIFGRIDRSARKYALERAKWRNKNTTLWWLQLPQPKNTGTKNLGKHGNGSDFFANLKYWTEGVYKLGQQSGVSSSSLNNQTQDSETGEEGSEPEAKRSWRSPWTFFAG